MTGGVVIDQGDFRRQDFRRMLKFSIAGHALLSFGFVTSSFFAPSAVMLPSVLMVDLVAAPPAAKPAPKAAAVAPAPKPRPKQVVLPEHANIPKSRAKPSREVVLEPKPKVEKSLDDLMNEFREDLGETPAETAPVTETAVQQPTAAGTGVGKVISAEEMAWRRAVRTKVTNNWVVEPGFRLQSLRTDVMVLLNASGDVMGTRFVERSGNPWFDASVERGIDKASPLPVPPEPGEWPFRFNSEEAL